MRPRSAGLVAQATLAKVNTGKTETDYNGNSTTTLELTFSLKLPGAKQQSEWKKYRDQNHWSIERQIKEALPKAEKPKKGDKTVAPKDQLTQAELDAQIDAILRPQWEAECDKIRQHNLRAMQQSAAFGMFMGLVKASVTLRVEPAQRGFEGMFEESVLLALPAGNGDQDDVQQE
jgi:hypothetical protein